MAMRSWARMSNRLRLATVAVVVAALALIGVFASKRFDTEHTAARPGGVGRTLAPTDDVKPVSKALKLGTDAKISSNYRITVTDATLYEGQRSQYLVATVKAEYIGKDDGDPWADLITEYTRDSQTLDESSCPADVRETNASDPPPMATGDVETYAVCFDLPTNEISGGQVSVEEAFSEGHRASWSTDGAVTKALPSPAPKPRVAQAPAARPRTQTQSDSSDRSDDIEEYKDDLDEAIEKYEKQRDDIDAQLKAWKKIGYHGDAVEDYEDWRDDVDEAIETYKEQREKLGD
jgi:uncharacterized protein YukE